MLVVNTNHTISYGSHGDVPTTTYRGITGYYHVSFNPKVIVIDDIAIITNILISSSC